MKIPHPQLQAQLLAAVETVAPGLEIRFRAMFGGAMGYAYEQAFASLSDQGLALKLEATIQEELLQLPGAKRLQYEPSMPPSKTYIVVAPAVCADAEAFGVWVGKSLEFVSKLPPKKKK